MGKRIAIFVFVLLFAVAPVVTSAQTVEELQALIAQLIAQLNALRSQVQATSSGMSIIEPAPGAVIRAGTPSRLDWGGGWTGNDTFDISYYNSGVRNDYVTGITQEEAGCPGAGKAVCSYNWIPDYPTANAKFVVEKRGSAYARIESGLFSILPPAAYGTCSETDRGNDSENAGLTKVLEREGGTSYFRDTCYTWENSYYTETKSCSGSNCFLDEAFCSGNKIERQNIAAPGGCVNGAVQKPDHNNGGGTAFVSGVPVLKTQIISDGAGGGQYQITATGFLEARGGNAYVLADTGGMSVSAKSASGRRAPDNYGRIVTVNAPKVRASNGVEYYVLREGVKTSFEVTKSYNVNWMFPGAYYGILDHLTYARSLAAADNVVLSQIGPFKSGLTYITGERAPWIERVEADPNNSRLFSIQGERLHLGSVVIKGISYRETILARTSSGIKIQLDPRETAANYELYLNDPLTGVSNRVVMPVRGAGGENPAGSPAITVTYPNGGETFAIDKGFAVTWKMNYNSNTVKIRLYHPENSDVYISPEVRGVIGENRFTIPANSARNPGQYKINVCDDNKSPAGLPGKSLCDLSNTYFQIVDSTATTTPPPPTAARVEIKPLSSNQPGNSLVYGSPISLYAPIRNMGGTAAANVRLDWYLDGKLMKSPIIASIPANSAYVNRTETSLALPKPAVGTHRVKMYVTYAGARQETELSFTVTANTSI